MDLASLDRHARLQHGLVTTQQLLAVGASESWISRETRAGRLIRARRGVFRLAGAPVTQEQAWMAGVLEAGADVVLSHHTAAAAWGLKGFDAPGAIHLLGVDMRPRLEGVRGHRTRALPESDRTRWRLIPTTTPARTLIDTSGGVDPGFLGRVIDDAIRRKLLTLPRLVQCFEEVPASGRRPSRAMKIALSKRVPGRFNPGGSGEELDVLEILTRAGISPLPRQQYRLDLEGHTYYLDYAWEITKHAIEYDGGGGDHESVSGRSRDRDRWRRIQRAGWTLWACTETTSEAEYVAIGVTATTASP